MKKTVKILIIFLFVWFISIVVSNAAIRSNDPTVNSGSTVSITLTSTQAIQAFKSNISSNGGLTFNSAQMGDFSGKPNGSNASGANPDGGTNLVTYTFTAPTVTTDTKYTVQFSGSISVEGDSWEPFSNKSTVTVKAPSAPSNNDNSNNNNNANNNNNNSNKEEEDLPTASDGGSATTVKSSNNYLKSLKLSTGSIEFNKKTTKYNIEVAEEIENITITANAEHEKATVKGTGTVALKKGTNTINVVVTAENGSARNYQLTVVRPGEETEEEESQEEVIVALTSLKLKGVKDNGEIVEIPLTPEFSADIFYYECEIPEGINFIDVEQACDILDAIVEVTGNKNLVDGENLINIIIKYTDENDEEQTITYQITATKQAEVITQEIIEEEKGLSPLQIGISIGTVSIALVIIIILIVKYRKQQNEEEYGEMDFGGYGEPFYSENEEEIFEKPIAPLKTKEEKEQEVTEEEKIRQEELDNWDDFEPVKKKKIFGKSAKKGKHF